MTLHANGTKSAMQVLRDSTSTKTCPQVEANALGQVAALWHEIEETQCGMWGADVLALRPAGATQFQAPEIVPGAQSDAALGILGLDDAGRLTVAYGGSSGGQLVSGPFGGRLTARQLEGGPVAAGTDQGGGDIVGVHADTPDGFATVRHEPDGDLTPKESFGIGGQVSDYMRVDQGAGRAAAMLMVYDQGLKLLRDVPGAPPQQPQPAGEAPGSTPPSGPRGTSAAATPLTVTVRGARVARRAVRVRVACSLRCTATARVTLRGRSGRRVRLASGARSLARPGTLTLRLSRRAARRLGRGPYRIVVRVEAVGPAGERAVTLFRR